MKVKLVLTIVALTLLLAEEEYLSAWRGQAACVAVLVFAVAVLSLFVGGLMMRSWRRGMAEVADIAESRQLLQTVAENTYDWIYWRSEDNGCFHYLSPACEAISGYGRADFEADPGLLDRIVHPDDRARPACVEACRTAGIGAAMLLPLTLRGETWGALRAGKQDLAGRNRQCPARRQSLHGESDGDAATRFRWSHQPLRLDPRRHQGAQDRRGAHRAPRELRPVDRFAQPQPVLRPSRTGACARASRRACGRFAVPRSGPLQGSQRQFWPRGVATSC